MTKDDALKLALEALEGADWYINQLEMIVYSVDDDGTHENRLKVQQAIAAIKEALAQPEQEPVAVCELQEDGWDTICDGDWLETLPVGTKLYTTPPKRPWVGLTNEDWNSTPYDTEFRAGAEWAEVKLKEKNS